MVHVQQEYTRFSETDAAKIIHFGVFSTYYEESLFSMLRTAGIPCNQDNWEKSEEESVMLPVVGYQIKFFNPVKFGDKVNTYSAISYLGEKSFTSFHVMHQVKDNTLCNFGTMERVTASFSPFKVVLMPLKLKLALEKNKIAVPTFTKNYVENLLKNWKKGSHSL